MNRTQKKKTTTRQNKVVKLTAKQQENRAIYIENEIKDALGVINRYFPYAVVIFKGAGEQVGMHLKGDVNTCFDMLVCVTDQLHQKLQQSAEQERLVQQEAVKQQYDELAQRAAAAAVASPIIVDYPTKEGVILTP